MLSTMPGISEFIKQPVEGDTSSSPSNKPIKPIKLPQRETTVTTCSPLPHSSAAAMMTSRSVPQTSWHQTFLILSGLHCDSLPLRTRHRTSSSRTHSLSGEFQQHEVLYELR